MARRMPRPAGAADVALGSGIPADGSASMAVIGVENVAGQACVLPIPPVAPWPATSRQQPQPGAVLGMAASDEEE